jgi:AraC family transcriptional regulator
MFLQMSPDESSPDSLHQVTGLLLEVQHHLDHDLSLESLARQYGYSPFHFHRFFSRTVGETPKQHIDRLRLERAAYKLAITRETVLHIALSVGFKNHETFSRAFKRTFHYTPRDYRRACGMAQRQRMERNRGFRGDGCLLSDVRFASLPAMTLLASRRHGAYADCPMPFQKNDNLWSALTAFARGNHIPHHPLALAISYDDPTVTPKPLQRLDACIPITGQFRSQGSIRRLDFVGGRYAGIDHAGPISTIDQAYRTLADGIRRSRYSFEEGPPVQIYRKVHIGGDPAANLTEVYFPIRPDA